MNIMKNVAQMPRLRETIREQFSLPLIFSILVFPAALLLGIVIGDINPIYGAAAAGCLAFVVIVWIRLDELTVTLIIAVHILVDWYLGLRLIAVLMGLVLLFACYFGRSANHPWVKPRPIWLWGLFLILTIYPAINGGSLRVYDADTFYPSIVLRTS